MLKKHENLYHLKLVLKVLGLNFIDELRPTINLFALTATGILFPILSVIFLLHDRNVLKILECLVIQASNLQVLPKILWILFKKDKIYELFNEMHNQRVRSLNIESEEKINQKYSKGFSLLVKYIVCLYTFVSIVYISLPVFNDDPYKQPMVTTLPFMPNENFPYWHINYVYGSWSLLICSTCLVGNDLTTLLFLLTGCKQFDILVDVTGKLNVEINSTNKKDLVRNGEIRRLFRKILYIHTNIKQFMDDVESTFSLLVLLTFFSDIVVICLLLKLMAMTITGYAYMYFMAAISQTFFYCFAGNLLLIKNEQLYSAFLEVDYYKLDLANQKAYRFILQNIMQISTCSAVFAPLNMETFVAIWKMGYSVFTLMDNVE